MASVTVRYKGEAILELNSFGSKTLKTAGKYCEADIELDYINYCPRAEQEAQYDMGEFLERWRPHAYTQSGASTKLTALHTDVTRGYVDSDTWYVTEGENCYSDIYSVEANKCYLIGLGASVGNRFRVMFSTTDMSQATSNVFGTSIAILNNPSAYEACIFETTQNGYIAFQKTNEGVTGLESFVYEVELT